MTLLQRNFANKVYWEKREREAREAYMLTESQELAEIDRIYREMYQWCDDEINKFYGRYAKAEGIDITEAKKRVYEEDVGAFQEKAKKYVKEKDFSDKANSELKLYNATMKINRLELLKAQIGLKLVDGTDELDKHMDSKLTERATEELIRQAGILGRTITHTETTKRAKEIVGASFKNATFSQRIWAHQDSLKNAIATQLQRGLIAGVGSRVMAQNIKKEFGVSQKNAERLMVTEMRRVQTDVAMDSYKAQGITQYEYMAVNPKACPICKELNGKVYDVKGAEVGDPDHPLPPMHPRCHCTTAPHVDEAEYEAWLNHLERGGRTEDWDNLDLQKSKSTKPQESEEVQYSKAGKSLMDYGKAANIEYRKATDLPRKLTENEIIERVGGGDETDGSCISLCLAYIANKAGKDVLDFRGGDSLDMFARNGNNKKLVDLNGVKAYTNTDKSSVKGAIALLTQAENGKEYMLVTGKHGAIIRNNNGKLQYLELQTENENGWTNFKGTYTLKKRFGCTKTRTVLGTKVEQNSYMIEIESLYNSDEFYDIVGYINTATDKQQKGPNGTAK